MVAEQAVKTELRLGAYNCPACGSSKRWDLAAHDNALVLRPEVKIRIYCDCGMGVLEIELVK